MATKKWREIDFGPKIADDCVYNLRVKNFAQIALSRTVSMINTCCILCRNSTWPPKVEGNNFWQTVGDDSLYTLWVKNFIGITLSHTVFKIYTFLHLTQSFKMASENGGKMIFGN